MAQFGPRITSNLSKHAKPISPIFTKIGASSVPVPLGVKSPPLESNSLDYIINITLAPQINDHPSIYKQWQPFPTFRLSIIHHNRTLAPLRKKSSLLERSIYVLPSFRTTRAQSCLWRAKCRYEDRIRFLFTKSLISCSISHEELFSSLSTTLTILMYLFLVHV